MPFDTTDKARAAGRRSGAARRRKAGLDLPDVPRLVDLASVLLAYDVIAQRVSAGAMAGSQGMAAVRAVDGYRTALDLELDRERVGSLERRIGELEVELAAARAGSLG